MTVHIAKNFMELPKIKIPLILGIWGGKGQGKTFQCMLAYKKLGINPIVMSAGASALLRRRQHALSTYAGACACASARPSGSLVCLAANAPAATEAAASGGRVRGSRCPQ